MDTGIITFQTIPTLNHHAVSSWSGNMTYMSYELINVSVRLCVILFFSFCFFFSRIQMTKAQTVSLTRYFLVLANLKIPTSHERSVGHQCNDLKEFYHEGKYLAEQMMK